jgi:hypothetical protein
MVVVLVVVALMLVVVGSMAEVVAIRDTTATLVLMPSMMATRVEGRRGTSMEIFTPGLVVVISFAEMTLVLVIMVTATGEGMNSEGTVQTAILGTRSWS